MTYIPEITYKSSVVRLSNYFFLITVYTDLLTYTVEITQFLMCTRFLTCICMQCWGITECNKANTQGHNNVVSMSLQRRYDVVSYLYNTILSSQSSLKY